MAIHITNAAIDEAPLVYDIMQRAFAEYLGVLDPPSGVHSESLDDVIVALDQGGAILAWIGSEAVGSARYAFREDSCYIGRVSVLPQYRGQGIASAMMEYIEGIARAHGSSYLEIGVRMVLESNINLYKRLGYTITEMFEHPKGGGMVGTMVKPL
ncbi:MAG: GNAT family N-acetyltransferase [Anaerolineae bacterium]